ncbi:MAG: NmrA family NAD(P)-binding protein [Anaerolineae bacterium]
MILVTGSSGKTGRTIIQKLAQKQVAVRAWARRPKTKIEGAAELFVGDMTNPADWAKAFIGVTKIYHICPNMHPAEVEIGRMAIAAAQDANIDHFVYHSVLHPQIKAMPHHWNKLLVEEKLFESNLPFTIVQPTAYIQNLIPQFPAIQQDGVLRLPYPAEACISLVDLNDVAEAVAIVLTSGRFLGAILELVGTQPLSQTEVATILADTVGRDVKFSEIPLSQWAADNASLPNYARETLLAMFRYYASYGLVGNSAVLEMILGRKPVGLAGIKVG